MNINNIPSKNNAIIIASSNQGNDFNQLSVQPENITTNIIPIMIDDSPNTEITSYQISNVVNVPNFSSVITGIPTDESFMIMCKHAKQDLVAQRLSNMLKTARYTDIRKWVVNTYYHGEDNFRDSPLYIAATYNNSLVCKVILEFLKPKTIPQKLLLASIKDYKLYGAYGHYHEVWVISKAFCAAVGNNEDLARYLYMLCSEDFIKLTSGFTYLQVLLTGNIKKCYNTSILDFLLKKTEQFLNTNNDHSIKEYFQLMMMGVLREWAEEKTWSMMLHVLDQNLDLNYEISPIFIRRILYYCLENKNFTVSLNILNKLSTDKIFYETVYFDIFNIFNKHTILDVAVRSLDVETVAWLLVIAKVSIEKNDIDHFFSTLDYALLRKDYTVAHLLRCFGAKLFFSGNIEANLQGIEAKKLLLNKRQQFLLNPTSLKKLAAISLGIQYIKNSTSVAEAQKEVSTMSLKLASEITEIEDVFYLNL